MAKLSSIYHGCMWSVGLNQVSLKIDSDRKDTLFFRDVQEKSLFGVIFCVGCRGEEYKATLLGNESTFLGNESKVYVF